MNRASMPIVGLLALTCSPLAPAGDLEPPPGPVTPTVKTLDQVEPRIPINLDTTPGDANSLYKITLPGSYYLTSDVTGRADRHGIEIDADDVTIDLMGYTLRGATDSLDGISFDGATHNSIRISNGIVRDWGLSGIALYAGTAHHAHAIHATRNGELGIACAGAVLVESCVAAANGATGIYAIGPQALVRSCTSSSNGSRGISIGGGSIIACTVGDNGDSGIYAGGGSLVADCSTHSNDSHGIEVSVTSTVTGCNSQWNEGDGIRTGDGSCVSDCTVGVNDGDGIRFPSECIVVGNNCGRNGQAPGDGAGIHATGDDNRIEDNNAVLNDRGIDVDDTGNLVIRNSASGNTMANYDIVPGNTVGPIITSANITISSNPHANYEH